MRDKIAISYIVIDGESFLERVTCIYIVCIQKLHLSDLKDSKIHRYLILLTTPLLITLNSN